jgi:hypothetical protein
MPRVPHFLRFVAAVLVAAVFLFILLTAAWPHAVVALATDLHSLRGMPYVLLR